MSSNAIYRQTDDTDDFEPVRPQMMEDMDLEDSQSYGHPGMKT